MRDIDPGAFASSGFDSNVKRLTKLLVRLHDFKDIEPNDFNAVALANSLPKDAKWPPEALRVSEKYGG